MTHWIWSFPVFFQNFVNVAETYKLNLFLLTVYVKSYVSVVSKKKETFVVFAAIQDCTHSWLYYRDVLKTLVS